jgi:hypothetical protein
MQTHRFGRKIKLPATVAIKHQIRMLMAQDIKKAERPAAEKRRRAKSRKVIAGAAADVSDRLSVWENRGRGHHNEISSNRVFN